MSERQWSKQQLAIFEEFRSGTGHVIIEALAGTGKTTTVVEGAKYAPERNILFCAFNVRIKDELTTRLSQVPGAQAKTLHGLGMAAVRKACPSVKMEKKDSHDREKWLTNEVAGTAPDVVKRLITQLHTKGREICPHARTWMELEDLAYRFDLIPDITMGATWNLEYICTKAVEAMELASTTALGWTGIDFSDQIFLPVRNRWLNPIFDLVIVDETQDMTLAQLELAQGSCRGRMIIVGDRNQAIYGFRGADVDSMDRLQQELKAKVLKLTKTYRCGRRIVEKAQRFVPEFEAGEHNPEGYVGELPASRLISEAEEGDFILSRTNAPLAPVAMGLLRSHKKARIAGKDIGKGLKKIVWSLKARTIPEVMDRVTGWEERQVLRLRKADKKAQIEMVQDQAETIIALARDAKSVKDLEELIDSLFTDDGLGQAGVVTCSSVHRAKGLEADRVFVLKKTLRDHTQEELNIQYVAITRAKEELIFVTSPFVEDN